jgi:hypothetical protein
MVHRFAADPSEGEKVGIPSNPTAMAALMRAQVDGTVPDHGCYRLIRSGISCRESATLVLQAARHLFALRQRYAAVNLRSGKERWRARWQRIF